MNVLRAFYLMTVLRSVSFYGKFIAVFTLKFESFVNLEFPSNKI